MARLQDGNHQHAIVRSFDDIIDAGKTTSVDISVRIDQSTPPYSYFGFALVGSNESALVWKIKRLTTINSITDIKYADGDANYDNSWTNRATLNYL